MNYSNLNEKCQKKVKQSEMQNEHILCRLLSTMPALRLVVKGALHNGSACDHFEKKCVFQIMGLLY